MRSTTSHNGKENQSVTEPKSLAEWKLVMDHTKIEHCEFSYRCPKTWGSLYETNIDSIRYCNQCERNVYLSKTTAEANTHAAEGHCVAIPIELTPYSQMELDSRRHVPGNLRRPPLTVTDRLAIQKEYNCIEFKWVGIDGCPAGWFYVGIGVDQEFNFGVLSDFGHVAPFLHNVELILIDIPIGLPSLGGPERLCDTAARKAIKPRGSSVFPVPARSALAMSTYEAGSEENYKCLGRKLSRQSWAIAPKIREVDQYMLLNRERRIREMHPEVAFWALNRQQSMQFNKKKDEGLDERLAVLERYYPKSAECFELARQAFIKKEVANDDIIDALVGAVTAMQSPRLKTFPASPSKDEKSLFMEMVFANP